MDYMQLAQLARRLLGDIPDEQQPSMAQLTNAQATQVEQPETPSGTDMVNDAISSAIRPAPNQLENNYRQQVLGAKQAYMDAQNLSQNPNGNDQTRALAQQTMTAANDLAKFARNAAQAAGFNTNPYGEGVSLEDTRNYIESERARDIVEALQGAYSINSEQYYEKAYFNALSRGLSPRRAKRDAGMRAREYQANRVAYLNGVYSNYGHDSRVTNDIGNQILGMIAMENPMLANLYGQVYPNQRDAYARDNQIEDKVLDQTNALELLSAGLKNDLTKMGVADMYNAQNAYRGAEISMQNKLFDAQLARVEQLFLSDLDTRKEIEKIRAASEQEQRKFLNGVQQGHQLALMLGLPEGSDAYRAVVYKAAIGKDPPNFNKGAFNKDVINGLNTFIETTGKQIEEIRERLTDSTLSDEERRTAETRLADLMRARDEASDKMGVELDTQVRIPIPPFTNDPDKDLPIIRALIAGMPKDSKREDILHDITHYIQDSPQGKSMSEAAIERYLVEEGLLPPRPEDAKVATPQATKSNQKRRSEASERNAKVNSANYLYNPNWESK